MLGRSLVRYDGGKWSKKQKGGNVHCVAGTPNKKSCTNTSKNENIKFHLFPSDPETRRRWKNFVQRHRPGFDPDKFSRPHLCSEHFEPSCYSKRFSGTLEGFDSSNTKCFLTRGSIPTIDATDLSMPQKNQSSTRREARLVSLTYDTVVDWN